jgi:hypothetical protein
VHEEPIVNIPDECAKALVDGRIDFVVTQRAILQSSRVAAIAAAAELIKAKSFTIDGEAVVLGPDGLSRFDPRSSCSRPSRCVCGLG